MPKTDPGMSLCTTLRVDSGVLKTMSHMPDRIIMTGVFRRLFDLISWTVIGC